MRFGWVTVGVADMDASLAFYESVVGLKVKRRMNPAPGSEIAFLGFDDAGTEVELIRNDENGAPEHGKNVSLGFEVDSLESQMELLDSKGIAVEGPFQPGPNIRFVFVDDPNGVKVQFFESLRR